MKRFKFLSVFVFSIVLGSLSYSQTRTFIAEEVPATPQIKGFAKASLPAAATAGRLARVTDGVRGIWCDNGSQWFQCIPGGEIINIQEFGASPSATAAANVTAFQTAIAALPLDGGRILFGCGVYNFNASIALPTVIVARRVTIEGCGRSDADGNGVTVLNFVQTNNTDGLTLSGVSVAATLRNLTIKGNASARHGIFISNAGDGRIIGDNLMIVGWTAGDGIRIEVDTSNTLWHRVDASGNGRGFHVVSGSGSMHEFISSNAIGNTIANFESGDTPGSVSGIWIRGGDYTQTQTIDAPAIKFNRVTASGIEGIYVEHLRLARNSNVIEISGAAGEESESISFRGNLINGSSQTSGTGDLLFVQYAKKVAIQENDLRVGGAVPAPGIIKDAARSIFWQRNKVVGGSGNPSVETNARPTFHRVDDSGNIVLGIPSTSDTPNAPNLVLPAKSGVSWVGGLSAGSQDARLLAENTGSIADLGTFDLGAKYNGLAVITTANGEVALYELRGGGNAIAEISDTQGIFSPTSGTASSTNIFFNAGTDAYRIENRRGAARTYNMLIFTRGVL